MIKNLSNRKKINGLIAIIIIIIGVYSSYTAYAAKLDKLAPTGNTSKSSKKLNISTLKDVQASVPEIKNNQTRIVGYYASWATYSGFTPDKIDANKLTHLNYAFANISNDFKIAIGDPNVDLTNFKKLNTLKQTNTNLKTLISVGGWTWSDKFSDVALTESSRDVFADSCVDFIVKYGFDGVDVDWEYPVSGGLPSNVKRPVDKQNFTLLLKTLREKLDAQGKIDGKKYLLTIAGATGDVYINNTELDILHQYLGFGNIMTYDIHGDWDNYTDFNAPLYNNADSTQQYKWSIDSAINA